MRTFTYYQPMPGFYMFTCWNKDHSSCGCHSVASDELATNIRALERMGYADRTGYQFNHQTREWVS